VYFLGYPLGGWAQIEKRGRRYYTSSGDGILSGGPFTNFQKALQESRVNEMGEGSVVTCLVLAGSDLVDLLKVHGNHIEINGERWERHDGEWFCEEEGGEKGEVVYTMDWDSGGPGAGAGGDYIVQTSKHRFVVHQDTGQTVYSTLRAAITRSGVGIVNEDPA
jgi:hypothetical protein